MFTVMMMGVSVFIPVARTSGRRLGDSYDVFY